ncbi:MAG: FecR domain-containing protein [Rudaea sp.]|uniref:FecR family protein n=1 Tax=Rudaea sp. TaxID=2136325 RepID=UPI0039E3F65C
MDSERIERAAADWLAKRDSGSWSEADEQAFSAWQNESTAHRIAVIRIRTTWRQADRLQALGAGVPRGEIPEPGSWRLSPFFDREKHRAGPSPSADEPDSVERDEIGGGTATATARTRRPRATATMSRSFALRACAAVLALGLAAAGAWRFIGYDPNVYRADIGDTKVVSLADGSTVTLNTDTVIHVALSAAERRIDLERGEAFFEVAKDPQRPFVVNAAGQRIVAVGTKFSVLREALDTRVVVTEGRVKVEELQGGATVGTATELPAGSIAQAGSAGVLVKRASVAEAETYMSWRSGYIALRDTELAAAVAEFNRYNRKQLVIADPSIATLRIGGNLRAANVEAFVRVLEEGFPVRAEDKGDRILLTGSSSR